MWLEKERNSYYNPTDLVRLPPLPTLDRPGINIFGVY